MSAPAGWRKLVLTFVLWSLAMYAIGAILNRTAATDFNTSRPAGFGIGMAHGAMMPLAFPRLALGGDVTIYALNNTGRTYALGYTLGVNLCGAIFFGYSFWWYSRAWRAGRAALNRSSA